MWHEELNLNDECVDIQVSIKLAFRIPIHAAE
jgi:hypothetical protein